MPILLATVLLAAPFGQAWAGYHADDTSVDLFVELTARPAVAVAYITGVDGLVDTVALAEVAPGVYGANWVLPRVEDYRVAFGAVFGDGTEEVSSRAALSALGVPLDVFIGGPPATPAAVPTPGAADRPWAWAIVAAAAGLAALALSGATRSRTRVVRRGGGSVDDTAD